jgi:hypothetical protein
MDEMDETDERDAFVVGGNKYVLEKGQRYRIIMRDERVYEGIFDGFANGTPWSHTVTLRSVIQITANGVVDCEHLFMSFEKARIGSVEKADCDLLAMIKKIEGDEAKYNFRERIN